MPAAPHDDAELRAELRAGGLRATSSRVGVLRALRAGRRPLSHNEMEALVAGSGWNRTTVYRNLLDLVRVGLARRFDAGDHVWRFEAQAQPAHPHFVCDSCGDVQCLPGVSVAIQRPPAAPKAVKSRAFAVQLRGTCDRCD
jgi:Fur family ferric uptake transcriptional regulator